MGLSQLTINVGQSGLGRRAPNQDKISGIIFYDSSPPAGFSSVNKQKVFSLAEAEALGITVAANPIDHYHVSEYFRIQPEGELWIGYFPVPAPYAWAEISPFILFAGGEIRQLAIYAGAETFATSQATAIQAIVEGLDAAYRQFSVLFAANMEAITPVSGWSSVGDLRALTAEKVTVVAGQDGGGVGAALYAAQSQSITCIGAALGAVSKSKVMESIGNPANFNVSDGTELEIPALANGDLISALTSTALGGIKDDGYLILRKYTPDLSGSYFERCPTAVAATNDFAWIEVMRMVDKAIRGIRTKLIPQLNSTLYLDANGKLSADTVGYFQDLGQDVLDDMKADGEISDGVCLVDPTQNVLSTSTLTVSVQIIPVGIAETIVVNIGLTTSI
ncbi:MAG TPA: DUF2586 family protein [Chryseolinea sp.]|nr:DUF2586 family protein [Chryseolinea sp.]